MLSYSECFLDIISTFLSYLFRKALICSSEQISVQANNLLPLQCRLICKGEQHAHPLEAERSRLAFHPPLRIQFPVT